MSGHDDDLKPEGTEGFKVSEAKTLDEYQKLGKSANLFIYTKDLEFVWDHCDVGGPFSHRIRIASYAV